MASRRPLAGLTGSTGASFVTNGPCPENASGVQAWAQEGAGRFVDRDPDTALRLAESNLVSKMLI